jgi:hypothetical protein
MRLNLNKVLTALLLSIGAFSAHADITDGHFGLNQIFDVQYYWSGTTLNASNFIAPYDMNFTHPTLTTGQYFAFFPSTTNPGTYGLGVYNANGTLASVAHDTGTLQAIGPDALFYIGSGFFGTVITTSAGYANGSSASFTNMDTSVSASDTSSYTWASTTPLSAGQTASSGGSSTPSPSPSPTAVTSSIITTVTPTSNNSPAGEGASKAVDGSSGSKYLNFDRANAGFTITLNQGKVIDGIKFTTANDFVPRDPTKFTLYGSNDGVTWTQITANQSTTLENISGRYTQTSLVTIANTNAYVYYFITFPSIKAIDQYGSVAGCQAALGNLACDSVQVGEVTYYYDSNNTTTSVASGSGTIANPGTPGSVSNMTPTVVSTAPGTDIVTTSVSNGATTSTTTVTTGTTSSVSVVTDTRDRQTKVLNINRNITVTDTTPVTTTVTQTTPVTTTTTTTPVTVTTYSDGTTTTTNGTPVVTTSVTNNVVTTSTTVNDVQVTSTDTVYSTRIDQFDVLAESNARENALLVSDPLVRHRVYDSEIKLVGANVNERTAFDMSASSSGTNTVDGYQSTANRYSLGIAHLVKTDLMIGARFNQVNLNMSGNDSTGSLYKNAINLYALWTRNDWLVKGDVGYAKNKFNTTHALPDLNLSNSASAAGDDVWAQVRLYTPAKKGFRLFAGARKEQNRRDYAIDSGSALSAVDYAAVNKITDTTEAGLRFDHYVNDKMSLYAEYSQNNKQLETGKAGLSYLSGKNVSIQLGTIQQRQHNLHNSGAILELKLLF